MEQAPALTMSSKTPSRAASPAPPTTDDTTPTAQTGDAVSASSGATSTPVDTAQSGDAQSTPSSSTAQTDAQKEETGTPQQTTAQRAFQHGLSKENWDQEVNQVMGTFNSWWGGFKKQSASAYTNIKAEVDKTVTQAQADIEYLRNAKIEVGVKDMNIKSSSTESGEAEGAEKSGESAMESDPKGKGKAREAPTSPTQRASDEMTPGTTFLNRITSSTSQLQQQLQSTFQSTLASASSNPAISNPAQLRAQLAENLRLSSARQNLQLSMKQAEKLAEEYMKKGDQFIKDAEKWMGDAVKVIPPDDDEEARYIATSWDGGDFYSFSTSSSASTKSKVDKGDVLFDAGGGGGKTPRPSLSGAALAGSRKEALLTRLREDKELLMVDPESEAESKERREEFRKWVENQWPEISKTGKEKEEGNIGGIRMALVPEVLTDEQFWQRYLFHKSMIEAEDEKRKKVLEASQQAQHEDFNWDDDDDASPTTSTDPNKPTDPRSSTTTLRPTDTRSEGKAESGGSGTEKTETTPKSSGATDGQFAKSAPVPAGNTNVSKSSLSTSTSPRDSEESYDLVSDQGGKGVKVAPPSQDDDDSDWE